MKLELTSALSRNTTDFPAVVSISENGDKVYAVYGITVDNNVNLAAELFKNRDGGLASVNTIRGDLDYSSIDSGHASRDFTKFSVLDDNQSVNDSKARIRTLNSKLQIVAERIFTDAFLPGYTFVGGQFSPNGSLVAVSYALGPALLGGSQSSILRILDANTLVDVASYEFVAGVSVGGATFFNFNRGLYVTIVTSQGILDFNNLACAAKPEYNVHVFSLSGNTLTKVVKQQIPQNSFGVTAFNKDARVYLLIGTFRAILNEINFYADDCNACYQAGTLVDGDELRIYKFTGEALTRISSVNRNQTIQSPVLHPDGRHLIFGQTSSDVNSNEAGFFQLVKLDGEYQIKYSRLGLAAPHFFTARFSEDGNWLIVGGANSNNDSKNLHNILLYKVSLSVICEDDSSSSSSATPPCKYRKI